MNPLQRTLGSALTLLLATAGAGLTFVASGPAGSAAAAPGDCQGQTPTIVATASGERLQGTDGVDVIHTLGFTSVTVEAKGGDDVICSYAGHAARIYGEEGDDGVEDIAQGSGQPDGWDVTRLFDGPGSDHYLGALTTILSYENAPGGVSTDAGARTVVAGADTDTFVGIAKIVGSEYPDTYLGSSGADSYQSGPAGYTEVDGDVIRTGAGDDTVSSYHGSVWLGDGDDTAFGYGATVAGEAGDDEIAVRMGGTAFGGPGADTLLGDISLEEWEVEPSAFRLSGGPGNDTLSPPYAFDGGGGDVCLTVCARGRLEGGAGTDTLDLNRRRSVVDLLSGRVRVLGGVSRIGFFERVEGSRYADVIRGDAHPNHFRGLGGDDVLVGRGGVDVLVGGKGSDRADGGAGADQCRAETQTSC